MPTPITLPGSTSLSRHPVSIRVPLKVAFDLKSLHRVTETVLGRLGCPNCHSGFDLRFDWIDEFVVDEELNVDALLGGPLGH